MATRVSRWSDSSTRDIRTPDIRSWSVHTGRDRTEVGTVEEVLLDERGSPRYLEVRLESEDRTVLLPAGHARTESEEEEIWLPGLGREGFGDVPDYEGGGEVEDEYDRRLARAYDGAYSAEQYYESPHFRTGDGADPVTPPEERPARVDSLDDVEVADHDPDPRGWTVVGWNGEALGTVDHLLGDTAAMKVRHLVVELDPELFDGEERRILVPAGHAELDTEEERVRVEALDRGRLEGYPAWRGGEVERVLEQAVVVFLDAGYAGDRRHRHPRYRPDRLRRD